MCGIGGILRTDGEPIPEEWLDAIDARIAYRGPDGHGRFRDRVEFVDESGEKRVVEVAFVHRRLSIIDHEDGGQPMVSERGRNDSEGLVAVVFNGCIYNHRELRKELESHGHRFVTDHSDTEVLIHGWREWSEALIDHLEGMYAFAVWDRGNQTLAVSRDWCGRKPLYVYHDALSEMSASPVVFSSGSYELARFQVHDSKNLVTNGFPGVPDLLRMGYSVDPRHTWLCEFVAGAVETWTVGQDWNFSPPAQLHRGTRKLSASDPSPLPPLPEGEGSGDIETQIDQAVARRLEADVPLGCFLSGGVDSSLIAYFAKKHKPDLMTFSVRMPDARYDESEHAQRVADHLGTSHTTLEVSMNPAEDLVHLIDILGQPFGDSSILPTYWVSKAAREHVKVALAGDGGDELFIGYERYLAAPFLARHWWWLRFFPASLLHRVHPKSKWNKLARFIDMARDYQKVGIAAMESIFTQSQIKELLPLAPGSAGGSNSGSHADQTCHVERARDVCLTPPQRGGLMATSELRNFDLEHYLPGDLLRKVDTASMAVALEVRCPFLDRDLARAVLAMPINQLIPGGKRKGLLRNIARKYLPQEIVDRPKMGFAIPIGEWFRSDFGGMKTLLLDHLNSAEPFGPIALNRKPVQRFIDEHMSGRRDHSHRLFTLLTLSIWARQTHTRTPPA